MSVKLDRGFHWYKSGNVIDIRSGNIMGKGGGEWDIYLSIVWGVDTVFRDYEG